MPTHQTPPGSLSTRKRTKSEDKHRHYENNKDEKIYYRKEVEGKILQGRDLGIKFLLGKGLIGKKR